MKNSYSLPTILGFDPGARQLGVSVFRGEELVFYAVKTIKRKTPAGTLHTARQIIKTLINEYRAEYLALEKTVFPQQRNSFVRTVFDEIKSLAGESGLVLFEYNPRIVRQTICGKDRATNSKTASVLAQKFPELGKYYNLPRQWQKRYFSPLFGAVAVGFVCAGEIRK